MVSPACEVNSTSLGGWTATTDGVNVAAGETVSIRLADTSGVKFWQLQVLGTDEQVVAPTLTVDTSAKTASFTAPSSPADGWALILESKVGVMNLGLDRSGAVQSSYTTTFGVYLLTPNNNRVGALNETTEGNASFGWLSKHNPLLRTPGGAPSGSAGGDWTGTFPNGTNAKINGQRVPWKTTARVAATSNITLSGTQTIDGVAVTAGQLVLVANQSTASQNGLYTVASGSWSRSSDLNSSSDAVPGSKVHVSEGTLWANTTWTLGTQASITLGSTSLVFTPDRVPTWAALATVRGATGSQSTELVCYATIGDGGGGLFDWDASDSSTADDGGTVRQATGVSTGRWKRRFSGPVYAAWFGVKTGDTSAGATNNTGLTAATSYVAATNKTRRLILPSGQLWLDNEWQIYDVDGLVIESLPSKLDGTGLGAPPGAILCPTTNFPRGGALIRTRGLSNCTFEHIACDGRDNNPATTSDTGEYRAGWGMLLDAMSGHVTNTVFILNPNMQCFMCPSVLRGYVPSTNTQPSFPSVTTSGLTPHNGATNAGTLANMVWIYVVIVTGGARGTATFHVSYDGGKLYTNDTSSQTVTLNASTDVVDRGSAHGLSNGDTIQIKTTGSLSGTGLSVDTNYVVSSATTNTFKVRSRPADGSTLSAEIDITGTGSGTHYISRTSRVATADTYTTVADFTIPSTSYHVLFGNDNGNSYTSGAVYESFTGGIFAGTTDRSNYQIEGVFIFNGSMKAAGKGVWGDSSQLAQLVVQNMNFTYCMSAISNHQAQLRVNNCRFYTLPFCQNLRETFGGGLQEIDVGSYAEAFSTPGYVYPTSASRTFKTTLKGVDINFSNPTGLATALMIDFNHNGPMSADGQIFALGTSGGDVGGVSFIGQGSSPVLFDNLYLIANGGTFTRSSSGMTDIHLDNTDGFSAVNAKLTFATVSTKLTSPGYQELGTGTMATQGLLRTSTGQLILCSTTAGTLLQVGPTGAVSSGEFGVGDSSSAWIRLGTLAASHPGRLNAGGTAKIVWDSTGVAFNGAAAALAGISPPTYTLTYSTASRTVAALTASASSGAYTGIDNAQAGSVYAKLTDINDLRTRLDAVITDILAMKQNTVSVIKDLGANTGVGLFLP